MSVPVGAVACEGGAKRLRAHLPLAGAFGTLTTPASAWTILTVGPAGRRQQTSAEMAFIVDKSLSICYCRSVLPVINYCYPSPSAQACTHDICIFDNERES